MQTPTATRSVTTSDTTPTYHVGDDSVILLGALALVSSKSEPGSWHQVDVVNGLCACKGFGYRRHCRHVDAVRAAEEQDRESAAPVVTPAHMYHATATKEAWLPESAEPQCSCGHTSTIRLFGARAGHYCGLCAPTPAQVRAAEEMEAAMAYDAAHQRRTGFARNN